MRQQQRRCFLKAGSALSITALSGCVVDYIDEYTHDRSGDEEFNPTPEPEFVLDRPAMYFHSPDRSSLFDTGELDEYGDVDWRHTMYTHPDTKAFTTSLDGDTLTVEFEAAVTRPVTLAVNVVAPTLAYNDHDAAFPEDNPNAFTADLNMDATEAELNEASSIEEHLDSRRFEFDVSGIDFPENVGVHADVALKDDHAGELRVLKSHISLPLTYAVDGDDRLRWRDKSPVITKGNVEHEPFGVKGFFQFEENGHTVTYYSQRNSEEIWAAAHVADTAEMQDYGANGDGGWDDHAPEEANDAHNKPEMRALAQRMWDAHTTVGITDKLDRLNAAADYVQALPYERHGSKGARKPQYSIFTREGDCSERTYLYAAILRCPPFETRVGYIYCDLIGRGAHAVASVDMDHLQSSDRDLRGLYTMRPSDYEDTPSNHYESEFAFLELVLTGDIGTFYPDRYDVHYFYGTNFNSDH